MIEAQRRLLSMRRRREERRPSKPASPNQRHAVSGFADRLHHALRHRHAQRHQAHQPLPPPDGGRGRVFPRRDCAGFDGTAGSDSDDRASDRCWVDSASSWRRRTRTRNSTADAVVILGGIVTSTFLNMIVIPALYLRYGEVVATAPARDTQARERSRLRGVEMKAESVGTTGKHNCSKAAHSNFCSAVV